MENISKDSQVINKSNIQPAKQVAQPRVRILSDQVVNQIAAGEVVERPSSVVKELVENSIDAGASEVTINIANGGKSLVEISDDGVGMGKHDALLAIERFGTSKISAAEDLVEIASLGFRGEALPSIASVSHFSLESQAAGEPGVEIEITGGVVVNVKEIERTVGTRIRVRRLFYNTPARRKFLRTDKTEEAQIKATISDFALAYPKIRFRLVVDGKESLSVVPANGLFERVTQFKLAGKKPIVIDEKFESKVGIVRLEAVLSQPLECVAGSNRLRLMVNGRVVRDKLLIRAIREGYGNFLRGSSYPAGVLSLNIPAAEVDVNVHPQKTEVRFRTPDVVFSSISVSIKRAFDKFSILPSAEIIKSELIKEEKIYSNQWEQSGSTGSSFYQQKTPYSSPQVIQSPLFQPEPSSESSRSAIRSLVNARYIGQFLKLYLLLEESGSLFLVDMHAAHERLRFFQIKQALLSGNVPSQLLLIPETFELPAEQIDQIDSLQPLLSTVGIDCDILDENSILVRGIPAMLAASAEGRSDAGALISDLLSLSPGKDWRQFIADRIDEVVARMACHSSVRSGKEMKPEEVYALLQSLEGAERSGLCPHGRPVVIELSEGELEKLFGRVQ